MVQVLVKLPSGPKPSLPEWRIVELQGDLMTSGECPSAGQYIGDLHYTKAGVPVLLVGHHILYGKEQDVDKPFLVIEKQPAAASSAERTKEYRVHSIVTKKVVFRSRPKPIVSSAVLKTGKVAE
ncbi:chromosome transmission fidelity protein 8 homolog [Haemaphysalis longicornis]